MKDLHIVTDVPSAYRVHLFRRLHRAMSAQGCGMRVTFLARRQRHRVWTSVSGALGFPHTFASGPTLYVRRDLPLHITPVAWWRTMNHPATWLLLGGS